MSDLRTRIAAIMLDHQHGTHGCSCGWSATESDWLPGETGYGPAKRHVADEVIAALKKDGLIFSIERHDYGQPRPSVFSAIRDFESEQLRRAEPPA